MCQLLCFLQTTLRGEYYYHPYFTDDGKRMGSRSHQQKRAEPDFKSKAGLPWDPVVKNPPTNAGGV